MHNAEKIRNFDYTVLIAALALVCFGIVMIYSASSIAAEEKYGTAFHFLKRQSLFALLGICAMVIAINFPYRWYRYVIYPALALSAASLVIVLLPPFAHNVGGASRWLVWGPVSFQPSEGAKLVLIIYLAHSLARKKERGTLRRFSTGALPHFLVTGLFMTLMLKEPDLGAALCIAALSGIMMFLAGIPLFYLVFAVLMAAPFLYVNLQGYHLERIHVFLKYFMRPWDASLHEAYHIKQSLFALANGDLLGVGLGNSMQKLFFLPAPHTDFIISVIGEEWGFVGIAVVNLLYIVILVSGARIAMSVKDRFGALLAMGIVFIIGLQEVINMAMAMGLLPTKGMALPFLSYGGSSLLMNLTAVGILIQLSSHAREEGGAS